MLTRAINKPLAVVKKLMQLDFRCDTLSTYNRIERPTGIHRSNANSQSRESSDKSEWYKFSRERPKYLA